MKTKLSFEAACAQYVHRFTMEHVPQWARAQREDGTYYAPHFRSDREWYENTIFPPHELCMQTDCYTSGQTWPLGQSLPEAYQVGYKGPGWEYKPYPQPEPFTSGEQAEEWSIGSGDDYLNVMIQDRKGNNIAEVICPFEADKPLVDKRARVIAAAPDLLAALEFIVNDMEPGEDAKLTVKGYNKACAAIKKAQP